MADYIELLRQRTKAEAIALSLGQMTGVKPEVVTDEEMVRVVWDQDQAAQTRQWLDTQIAGMLQKDDEEPDTLRIELGPVLGPWALKYAAPIIAGAAIVGYFAGRGRRARRRIR